MKAGIKELADRLIYDPLTGSFIWKRREERNKNDAAFNTRFAGREAGCVSGGYRLISLQRVPHLAHHVAWFILHGEIPDGLQIDHINGDKADNRGENLRLVDASGNARNRPVRSDNSTGFQGVYKTKHGTYYAQECVNGRNRHLGTFPTFEQAVAARIASQNRVGGFHPNHGRKAA